MPYAFDFGALHLVLKQLLQNAGTSLFNPWRIGTGSPRSNAPDEKLGARHFISALHLTLISEEQVHRSLTRDGLENLITQEQRTRLPAPSGIIHTQTLKESD